MALNLIALWVSGITFTAMTVIAGMGVRADEQFVIPAVEKWAGRSVFVAFALLALFVLTAAVL